MVSIEGTYIMRELQVNSTFYKDGSGLSYCPILLYEN